MSTRRFLAIGSLLAVAGVIGFVGVSVYFARDFTGPAR